MKFKNVDLENFGLIVKGTIAQHKINVFFGHNNSGKSFVARLIHGINLSAQPNLCKSLPPTFVKKYPQFKKIDTGDLQLHHILYKSDIRVSDVATHNGSFTSSGLPKKKKPCSIRINTNNKNKTKAKKSIDITLNNTRLSNQKTISMIFRRTLLDIYRKLDIAVDNTSSAYISAGRSVTSMGRYEESFQPTIAKSSLGAYKNVQKWFSILFPGCSLEIESHNPALQFFHKDSTGFVTELYKAGSGVFSAFSILAGIQYVKVGGTLIIEEPEAHLEPSVQFRLLDILHKVAEQKKVNLLFITHSDYIVKKLQGLVSQQILKPSDLGMYCFERDDDSLTTTISHKKVDKDGSCEQPTFDAAIDALVEDFSR